MNFFSTLIKPMNPSKEQFFNINNNDKTHMIKKANDPEMSLLKW